MSTALVRQDEINLDDLQRMARLLVASGYFDAKGAPEVQIAQLATKILAGRELGYGPYTAVQGIHIIQGKPQVSANLMAAAVKAHPRYDYRVRKMTDDEVAIEFFENKEKIGISTFSAADARRAGTQNVQKFPRNMLFARALSNGVRWYTPDVFFGNSVYVEGEIGEVETEQVAYIIVDRESGEVIESPPSINSLDDVEAMDSNPTPASEEWDALVGVIAGETSTQHDEKKGVQLEKVAPATLKHLHAVGTEAYGDDWDKKRHELVDKVTAGAANSSSDLTPKEAATLISGMEKKIAAAAKTSTLPA